MAEDEAATAGEPSASTAHQAPATFTAAAAPTTSTAATTAAVPQAQAASGSAERRREEPVQEEEGVRGEQAREGHEIGGGGPARVGEGRGAGEEGQARAPRTGSRGQRGGPSDEARAAAAARRSGSPPFEVRRNAYFARNRRRRMRGVKKEK